MGVMTEMDDLYIFFFDNFFCEFYEWPPGGFEMPREEVCAVDFEVLLMVKLTFFSMS